MITTCILRLVARESPVLAVRG